ncbi:hypothetical protein HME9302_00416 [Alteripontixanthobacter maritimus]|uniref:GTP-binding protein n=1 Tax=Alteripontixanthobacter maritimus TaxID=2161824 RepID=A0A369Q455_9SPHN|nr:DUF2721 domain-containing protein [Alteripontixanthobacter maritimus]RDC59230.1 hypothetical protein HME9302_00416 [Alteripontixanthobacter maritimus]
MLELLLATDINPSDILERTSSTLRVQSVVQLSLAPAFLLAAIGAIMNVMTNRLIWVADRIERITRMDEEGRAGSLVGDLPSLEQRRNFAQSAVLFSTLAALTISVVIALLFISAFITPQIGQLTALAWIVTMAFLVTGLGLFAMETRVAAHRNRERLKEAKARRRMERAEDEVERELDAAD